MSAYQLVDGVYYVSGASRGALCDTRTGNVYSIDDLACQRIEYQVNDIEFWQRLVDLNLAESCSYPPNTSPLPSKTPIDLDFMWLELVTDNCNVFCKHCYANSMSQIKRLQYLPETEVSNLIPARPKMAFTDWIRVLNEGYELGCKRVQFIGGEPFIYVGENKQTVLDLASVARKTGFEFVEIFTNGTLITPDKVKRIKNLDLDIKLSLFSVDSKTHDLITQTNGSFAKTKRALEMLKDAGVRVRVEIPVMKWNQDVVEPVNQYLIELGISPPLPDPIRPTGRGKDETSQPNFEYEILYGYLFEPDFSTNPSDFARNLSGNNCLAGRIAITEYGDILPCVFSRDENTANLLRAGSLIQAINNQYLQTIWHQTKDHVFVCKDCEYRYVCIDCRPLAKSTNKHNGDYLTAPYPRCTYNPYTGEWGKGAWRINANNKLEYDRAIAPFIEKALANRQKIKV